MKEVKPLDVDGNVKNKNITMNFASAFKKKKMKNPCWKGYEMVGTKKKKGKTVPNCVPKKKKK